MKKTIDTIVGIIGGITTLLNAVKFYPEYESVFMLIIGIVVGYFLSNWFTPNIPTQPVQIHTTNKAFQIILLLAAPIFLLLAIITVLKWLNLMNDDLLRGILTVSAFLLFFIYIFEFVAFFSSDEENSHQQKNQSD